MKTTGRTKAVKKLATWICVFSIILSCGGHQYIYSASALEAQNMQSAGNTQNNKTTQTAEETDNANNTFLQNQKQRAVDWIMSGISKTGSFGDYRLINDTCSVAAMLNAADKSLPEQSLLWIKEKIKTSEINNDILARAYMASEDKEMLAELLHGQNKDGGFGLTADYMSDTLDSVLAFESMVKACAEDSDGGYDSKLKLLDGYFTNIQNDDGGFGYTIQSASDKALSLKTALASAAYKAYSGSEIKAAWQERLSEYIEKNSDLYAETPLHNIQYMLYKGMIGKIDIKDGMNWIKTNQKENGSFSDDLETTVYAVYFMCFLERQNQPYFRGNGMSTSLSSYVIYKEFEADITADTVFHYNTNREQTGKIRIESVRGEKTETLLEKEITLPASEETAEFTNTAVVKAESEENLILRVILYIGGTTAGMTEDLLKVQTLPEENPVLGIRNDGTDGVYLNWNDISNDYYRYGYRIYRSEENKEFETRSSWDGEEKVRVLNIYPCAAAQNYLREWMSAPLKDSEEAAGRGLFEIDTVSIYDYNSEPDKYLKDENGIYRYDVLFFGAYDSNAYRDLNERSYTATVNFADSGRGVLFGHDTVVPAWTYFKKFAGPLGIKLINRDFFAFDNKVKVVNSGFLTSYPWKIEGVLTIPTSHANSQYTGGNQPAEVWMEFTCEGAVDDSDGTKANAYLFSNNQFAMIQTGHSSGQATDDERKVLANTLFYLKQLTNVTQAADKSAYDLKAPVIDEKTELTRNEDVLEVSVNAKDYGTNYKYYVEAVPQGSMTGASPRKSDVVETTVTSGVSGYYLIINESEGAIGFENESSSQNSTKPVFKPLQAENGTIMYELPKTEEGRKYYLHMWAADNAGNVSREKVLEVPEKKNAEPDTPDITHIYNTGFGLFGAEDVTAYIGELDIKQDVYSGGSITCAGSKVTIGGSASAADRINLYTGEKSAAQQEEYGKTREMPLYHQSILGDMSVQGSIETLNIYESTEIKNPTWCTNTTGAYCPELIIDASLMCDNTVNIGAGRVICGQNKDIALYSVNGDISINTSDFSGRGLIYAPNGTVTINVQNMQFAGSIIAKRIMIQGTTIQIGGESTNEE